MTLTLYSHPFSSYCQKVLTALWENDTPFEYRHLEHPGAMEELTVLWPLRKFPVLVDDGKTIIETTIIIEYLDEHFPGAVRLLPAGDSALEVRFMDRYFDQYVMDVTAKPVGVALKADPGRKEEAIAAAKAEASAALDRSYAWLEDRLANRIWAAGDEFTMADCAAAPSLFYADWVHQIAPTFPRLREYRAQLLSRPSFARAVEEGRPYRHYFPLGAPDRD